MGGSGRRRGSCGLVCEAAAGGGNNTSQIRPFDKIDSSPPPRLCPAHFDKKRFYNMTRWGIGQQGVEQQHFLVLLFHTSQDQNQCIENTGGQR